MTTEPLDLSQFDGHTPGPWVAHISGGIRSVRYEGASSGTWPFVSVAAKIGGMSEVQESNARLIAAAPDLLAECHRLATENAALRADAERYKWLRDPGDWWQAKIIPRSASKPDPIWHLRGAGLDAAIDAALAARTKGEA